MPTRVSPSPRTPASASSRSSLNSATRPIRWRALRGARSALLGLIVRDVSDPFFALGIEAITNEARRRGYGVVLGHARSRASEAAALQETLAT